MPAILTNSMSVCVAEMFVNSFVNSVSNIFMAVGRGDGTNASNDAKLAWEDETNPPTPVDTIEEVNELRTNIIGMKRVMISGIMLMVPRIEWQANKLFNVIDDTAVAGKRATDYFCINSENNVYQCIHAPGNLTAVGSEPQGYNTITTADGYQWKFLYNITAAMVNGGMLLDNWMPVPFNMHGIYEDSNQGTITDRQYLSGDVNANRTLGAYRVLITCTLQNEGEIIPYTSIYRQIALIIDPKNKKGEFLTGDLYAPGTNDDQWDINSGEVVYFENRKPTYREESMRESIEALIIF